MPVSYEKKPAQQVLKQLPPNRAIQSKRYDFRVYMRVFSIANLIEP